MLRWRACRSFGFDRAGQERVFLPSMERRKVLKGIAAAAGVVCARPLILAMGQDQTSLEKSSFALPIRGMANKGGRLVQPIQLTIAHAGTEATLVVRADHQEVERRVLTPGTHTSHVYGRPIENASQVPIDAKIPGKSDTAQ